MTGDHLLVVRAMPITIPRRLEMHSPFDSSHYLLTFFNHLHVVLLNAKNYDMWYGRSPLWLPNRDLILHRPIRGALVMATMDHESTEIVRTAYRLRETVLPRASAIEVNGSAIVHIFSWLIRITSMPEPLLRWRNALVKYKISCIIGPIFNIRWHWHSSLINCRTTRTNVASCVTRLCPLPSQFGS